MLYYSLQILSGIEGNIDYISPKFKGRNIDRRETTKEMLILNILYNCNLIAFLDLQYANIFIW